MKTIWVTHDGCSIRTNHSYGDNDGYLYAVGAISPRHPMPSLIGEAWYHPTSHCFHVLGPFQPWGGWPELCRIPKRNDMLELQAREAEKC